MKISKKVQTAMESLQLNTLRKYQIKPVNCILDQNDTLVIAPTSARKSAMFQFPGEVVKCHAYMDSEKREKHELQFINGSKRILVATTAFGMGVGVPDIRLVVHFNLPLSVIDYYQQIGRAGRDGETFHAVLLYSQEDKAMNLWEYVIKTDIGIWGALGPL